MVVRNAHGVEVGRDWAAVNVPMIRCLSDDQRSALAAYAAPVNPCCSDRCLAYYPEGDGDDWYAPLFANDGGKFDKNSRYYLHDREFMHWAGVHDDAVIAERMGTTPRALRRLLGRAGLTFHSDTWVEENRSLARKKE